jgi:DNA-binding SARP family transcriptional activator
MEFRVLGPLEVVADGHHLDVRGSKRRAVLALLVLHANEVVRTDRLIEDLWGGRPPANASAALHNHVSRLRKDIGGDVLVTKPWGYVLRTDPDAVDLHRFERLVAQARPLAAGDRAAQLAEALALWRGPPLADLADEPALVGEVARLEELRLSALEHRIDAELELGRHDDVIPQLEALVGEEPLRERLRGQLILALYRSGRQAEALETYRETRRVLVEELGIEPSAELRELERAILRQDPLLVAAEPAVEQAADVAVDESRWRWPRSPLLLGAAVLVVSAGAGLVAGIVATRGNASHDRQAGTTPPASQAPVTVTTPGPKTIVEIRDRTVKQRAPRTQTAHATSPRVRNAQPRATRTATTTPAKRATGAKQAEAPPPKVYWLTDNFEDTAFNSGMWHIAGHGQGVEVAERNARLELSIAPDITPQAGFVEEHYGTQCRLVGDFDARVQFKLLTWPPANGTYLQFGAYFPVNGSAEQVSREGRWVSGAGWDAYTSSLGWSRIAATSDSTGTLRLLREGGVLSGYYRAGREWIRLGSERSPHPTQLMLGLSSNAEQFGHASASVAFDNFSATADDVECPGVPLPPQKPRI